MNGQLRNILVLIVVVTLGITVGYWPKIKSRISTVDSLESSTKKNVTDVTDPERKTNRDATLANLQRPRSFPTSPRISGQEGSTRPLPIPPDSELNRKGNGLYRRENENAEPEVQVLDTNPATYNPYKEMMEMMRKNSENAPVPPVPENGDESPGGENSVDKQGSVPPRNLYFEHLSQQLKEMQGETEKSEATQTEGSNEIEDSNPEVENPTDEGVQTEDNTVEDLTEDQLDEIANELDSVLGDE